MHSSLGFRTLSLFILINSDDTTKLITDFKNYSRETGLIKIYPVDGDYHITYYKDNRGIQWIIKRTDWSFKLDSYIVEVKINPKILGGIHDYITAATFEDMEAAITSFNKECSRISPLLENFSQYKLQRIDYCINFYLDELAPECSPELIIDLIKRSDIPTHYDEYMRYDEISHRMKSPPESFYLKNKSVNINCYSKQMDLQNKSDYREQKGLSPIPQVTLDTAHNIIRFEVQCKYAKMYALTKSAEKAGNLDYNKYKTLLTPETCNEKVTFYYNKIIGKGDWYTLHATIKKVKDQHFHRQKENRLIDALQLVNQCRSLAKAKAMFQGSDLDAFKRTLKDLTSLGISPVTIPKDKEIKRIPNLLYAYFVSVKSPVD